VECTVNRVGSTFIDQLELNGHARRMRDMEPVTAIGMHALRFPLLWERTAARGMHHADWSFGDERLPLLQTRGIRPIVGLLHHGSGPPDTHLLDPDFPQKLAAYARAVAERYPFVADYTPVNEPVTTARFSALYGHWYPHARDTAAFLRALFNQCRGIALAMAAIRELNPHARLVQTEELGRVFSTRHLTYQADYENQRRLLGLDLLCGNVGPAHRFFHDLRAAGVDEQQLDALCQQPCPPDVIGVNYYLTSDRFLDERLERYPSHTHGGNGRERYADVEAVRVAEAGACGYESILLELWDRYRIPLAITEAHLGCTREQQLRWLRDAWIDAQAARRQGADVRAVTVWSLFGSVGWDRLVTQAGGRYEPGVFDVRGVTPRPTALASAAVQLRVRGTIEHPAAQEEGWWRTASRVLYPAAQTARSTSRDARSFAAQPLLISGAGTLGQMLATVARLRGLRACLVSRRDVDITDPDAVAEALARYRPWAVINAAGYVRVDDAELEPARCFRENVTGPRTLVGACRGAGLPLLSYSTDLVFDGRERHGYVESDAPNPLCTYGHSKLAAERLLLDYGPALVIRTAAFFGCWERDDFLSQVFKRLMAGMPVNAADDLTVTPTCVRDLAHASLDLLIDGECGLWHISHGRALSWLQFARLGAGMAGFDPELVRPAQSVTLGMSAPRPVCSALKTERGQLLRPLEEAIEEFIAERALRGSGGSAAAQPPPQSGGARAAGFSC
jgi:dTDP-4-dehydrorhamnose reductase